jgi:thiamine pyrophosphokinase
MEKDQYIEKLSKSFEVTFIGPLYTKGPESFDHPYVFVDRGVIFKEEFTKRAKENYWDFSVGDGDSSPINLDLTLNPNKDFSDLSFALSLLPKDLKKLNLWGFLGGRRDHEMINLGEVHQALLNSFPEAVVSFEDKIIAKNGAIEVNIQGTFSLIVLENTKVKIQGNLDYPLPDFTSLKPLSSHGLSNVGRGLIKIDSKGPYFIFLP